MHGRGERINHNTNNVTVLIGNGSKRRHTYNFPTNQTNSIVLLIWSGYKQIRKQILTHAHRHERSVVI